MLEVFREYIKRRKLVRFMPWPHDHQQYAKFVHERQKAKVEYLENCWPEFPAIFTEHFGRRYPA